MASHKEPTEGTGDVYPIPVAFIDRKTGTEYAADGTVINTTDPYLHDDRTADDVPMVDISEEPPAPSPPPALPYGVQNQVPWIISQQPSQYAVIQQPWPTHETVVQQEEVNSFLPLSIFVCLFCCCPLGLWAIIKSLQSRTLASKGKYLEAKKKGQEAKTSIIVGIIMGIILSGLYIGAYFLWVAEQNRRYR